MALLDGQARFTPLRPDQKKNVRSSVGSGLVPGATGIESGGGRNSEPLRNERCSGLVMRAPANINQGPLDGVSCCTFESQIQAVKMEMEIAL